MKTADRENPKRWATTPANRANGAAGQNRSCSFKGAAKEEKLQPQGRFFLLTSTFIELIRSCGLFDLLQARFGAELISSTRSCRAPNDDYRTSGVFHPLAPSPIASLWPVLYFASTNPRIPDSRTAQMRD